MGNCLKHQSSMQWAGDDWGSVASCHGSDEAMKMEEEGLLAGARHKLASSSSTEIKIKITKKQLEELLGKVDVKELSVQQVLAQLISVGDLCHETHQRSWRPALQSIPEVN